MTNVSRTNRNGKRPKSNFYPTPVGATRALIKHQRSRLSNYKIWEPAAGNGRLGDVLHALGFFVTMTELRSSASRRYMAPSRNHPGGRLEIKGGANFFKQKKLLGKAIITNPPYGDDCDAFIRHALNLQPEYAAFFLPITYLAGVGRTDLIEGEVGGLRLRRVLVFRERVTLGPEGLKLKNSGVVTYAWFCWERVQDEIVWEYPMIERISEIKDGNNWQWG